MYEIRKTKHSHDHCSYYLRACCQGMCKHPESTEEPTAFENGPYLKPYFYEVAIRYVQDNRRQTDRVVFESMADATRYGFEQALILRDFYNEKRNKDRSIKIIPPETWKTGSLISYKISRGYSVTIYIRHESHYGQ